MADPNGTWNVSLAPVADHASSDDVGVDIRGAEEEGFWKVHKGAG